MKKLTLLALCGLLSLSTYAQKNKSKTNAPAQTATPAMEAATPEQDAMEARKQKSESVEWPQLDTYHKVMATTFHPAEKGDFKPIRMRSEELLRAVKELIGNPFPKPYQTAEMKMMVAQLESQTETVNKLARSKSSDKDLMVALNETHEIFHKIAGMCSKEGDEHHK